jgi:AcrR family transcriptional regulator
MNPVISYPNTPMAEQPTLDFENSFLSRARYPKGKKRLQAILDATYEIVISEGLGAASQDEIAKRANVTQSAVRHYFPTKDELVIAFFFSGIERLQQLLESASLHYDRMMEVEDVFFFEGAAFWGRNPELGEIHRTWYQALERYYIDLIRQIHPEWDKQRCVATSFQVLTLVLGGWISMGTSRPFFRRRSRGSLKSMLLSGIEQLID